MPVSGLDWKYQVRDFTRLFRRWGSIGSNIRGVFNGIYPVQIVDRFRGDDEGSLFGLYAEATPIVGDERRHPSVIFGTEDPNLELEVLGFQAWTSFTYFPPSSAWTAFFHVFSPQEIYNPVEYLRPVGFWAAGLITNYSYTQSAGRAVSGYAPLMPAYASWTGYVLSHNTKAALTTNVWIPLADQAGAFNLNRPIRVPPQATLCFQCENPTASAPTGGRMKLGVAILFRQRRSA